MFIGTGRGHTEVMFIGTGRGHTEVAEFDIG